VLRFAVRMSVRPDLKASAMLRRPTVQTLATTLDYLHLE
jgi:hypothetical protein